MEILNLMFKGINSSLSPPTLEKQTEHEELFLSMLMAQMMPMTHPSPDMQPMGVQEQKALMLIVPLEGKVLNNEAMPESIPIALKFQPLRLNVEHQVAFEMIKPMINHTIPINFEVNHQQDGHTVSQKALPLEHHPRPSMSDKIVQTMTVEPTSSVQKAATIHPEIMHQMIQEKIGTNIPMQIQVQTETSLAQEFKNVVSKVMIEKAIFHNDSSSKANITGELKQAIMASSIQDQSQISSEFDQKVMLPNTQDQSQISSEFDQKIIGSDKHDQNQMVNANVLTLEPIVVQSMSEIKPIEVKQLNELELNQTINQMIQSQQKEMTIKLKPEGIGEIVIKLTQDNKVEIKFNVINAEVLNSIEKQLPHLQVSLKEYNVMIETSLNFNHQQKEQQREHSVKHHHSRLNHDVESKGEQQPTLTYMNRFNRYA